MMWRFALLLFVGAAFAEHDHAWKTGQEYKYLVRSRTLTTWNEISNQYTGILMKSLLTIQPTSSETLLARLTDSIYAEIHTNLESGYESDIPDENLEFRAMPLSKTPFEVKMKHGVVRDLITDKSIPTWEVNLLKSIVGQLQVDTQGENSKRSSKNWKDNQVPESEDDPYATFRAMEDTVGGKCEVMYDVTPLPEHVRERRPELVPLPDVSEGGMHMDVMKTKNYSRCEQRAGYHFGITGKTNWEPGANENGRFLSKSTTSRIVISGTLKRFTIQSSVTTNKIVASPRVQDDQTITVVSRMNLTIASRKPITSPLSHPPNPESNGNLVYSYNSPFSPSEGRKPGRSSVSPHSREASDSSSRGDDEPRDRACNSGDKRCGPVEKRRNRQEGRRSWSGESSEEGSSYSKEDDKTMDDFWQKKPRLDEAPENPFLPFSIGYKGKAVWMSKNVDPILATNDLVDQIASELEDPNEMPIKQTLEKFTMLTKLVRTMSKQQINEAEQKMQLINARSDKKSKEQNKWQVFRDAVTQAGTGPALLTIRDWIKQKKMEGIEAADVVMRLASNAITPTAEYMDEFFSMAKSPEVQSQNFLNTSAILAFTDLVRYVEINNQTQHNRYPVHVFGRMVPKQSQAVLDTYIPYLRDQLANAIKNEDGPKSQTYITALGNIAHPKILSVYEPFLEGKIKVPKFQRLLMLASLSSLAEQKPRLARSVFYKFYVNRMEDHELRCMAVFLLMKTNPPLSMLQRMADFTNYDSNRHVNSAVKSSIMSAAELTTPEMQPLARNAKIARELLSKNIYGYEHSRSHMEDSISGDNNFAYKFILNYIGSNDDILPRYWYFGLMRNFGGYEAPKIEFVAMISSIKNLLSTWMTEPKGDMVQTEKIAKLLNIMADQEKPLQGNLHLRNRYGRGFVPFDRNTLKKMSIALMNQISSLKDGRRININKLANTEIIISFPTETGLPFTFISDVPVLFRLSGSASMKDSDWGVTQNAEFGLVLAEKVQSRVGFVTPFDHQYFISGLDNNVQIYVPAKVEMQLRPNEKEVQIKIGALDTQNRLLHSSQVPYTAKHDLLDLRPVTEKNSHVVIKENIQKIPLDPPYGMGGLKIELRTDSMESIPIRSDAKKNGPWEGMMFPWSWFSNKYHRLDVTMDNKEKGDERIVLTAAYDKMTNDADAPDAPKWTGGNENSWMKRTESLRSPQLPEKKSRDRRKQLMMEAMKGINSAKATVLDLSLRIPGIMKNNQILSVSWARSNVDEKSRILAFYHFEVPTSSDNVDYEICATGELLSPQESALDLSKVATKSHSAEATMDVRYGQTCGTGGKVQVKSKAFQSEELSEKILKTKAFQACLEDMKRGNKDLKACQEAKKMLQVDDEANIEVRLDMEIPQMLVDKAIGFGNTLSYPDFRVNSYNPRHHENNRFDVKLKIDPNMDKGDVTVSVKDRDIILSGIELYPLVGESSKLSTDRDKFERNLLAVQSDEAYCTLDNSEAVTFDGRNYPLRIGKCSYVAMTTFPREKWQEQSGKPGRIPEERQVSVVVRGTEDGDRRENRKDVTIFFGDTEVQLKNSGDGLQALVNGKPVKYSKDRSYRKQKEDEQMFEIFELRDGSIKVVSERHGVDLVYDGHRVEIQASSGYRGSVRGLCGNYDNQPENDLMTPAGCVLRKPEEFIATYALTQDCEDETTLHNLKKAQQSECNKPKSRPSNVISNAHSDRPERLSNHWGYHNDASTDPSEKKCQTFRTRAQTVDDQICFTKRPVPTCAKNCSPTETKWKEQPMYCIKRTEEALEMKRRIENGANPDFSQKYTSRNIPIEIPIGCKSD